MDTKEKTRSTSSTASIGISESPEIIRTAVRSLNTEISKFRLIKALPGSSWSHQVQPPAQTESSLLTWMTKLWLSSMRILGVVGTSLECALRTKWINISQRTKWKLSTKDFINLVPNGLLIASWLTMFHSNQIPSKESLNWETEATGSECMSNTSVSISPDPTTATTK